MCIVHPNLKSCVDLETTVFALKALWTRDNATVPPGVWYLDKLLLEVRANVMEIAKEDAIT